MGKFTDKFFSFPIKIYDPYSLRKSQEYEEDVNIRQEAEWVQGVAELPASVLDSMYYQDWYSEGRTAEEIREEGFNLTMVYSDLYGEFVCTWPKRKFKEKLNEFMEKNGLENKEKDLVI